MSPQHPRSHHSVASVFWQNEAEAEEVAKSQWLLFIYEAADVLNQGQEVNKAVFAFHKSWKVSAASNCLWELFPEGEEEKY